jgi:hypothetical protein
MFNFLKLEIEKARLKKYFLISLAFNFIFSFYGLYMYYIVQKAIDKNNIEQSLMFSYEGALGLCDSTIRCMMIMVAGFLLNKIIINEYNKKTMDIIFLCPVDRKKVIRMKSFLVISLTFLGLVFGQIFTATGSTVLAYSFGIINILPSKGEVVEMLIRYLYNDVCYSLIGLIPLAFGMKCKLPRNTIYAAAVVTIISFFGFEQIIFSFLPFKLPITPAILAVFGIISLVLSMKIAEKECTF